MLAILALLFLALTVFLALKAFRAPPTVEKPADKQLKEDPFHPERLKETKQPEAVDSRRDDYMIGWMASLGAFLAVAAVAAWLLAAPPAADEMRQRTDARVAILALGAALGALAIVAGVFLFYQWRESLTGWLDRGESKQARWVLIPLLMIVAGAGTIFFAIQPARADERNNSAIRRTVYWTNFGLTALLLLVAFVVANILFSLKVPNKLDTTSTGFYALTTNTKNLLSRLNEPVTAYAVKLEGDDRIVNDIRQLLLSCQDVGDSKFKVKFVSEVANRTELASLVQRYPQLDRVLKERMPFGGVDVSGAVLLTTGEDEKRHSVIPGSEFATAGEKSQPLFQGEARLFKEVAFLADSERKPVVYFTQGNKELDISGNPDASPVRSGARLKAYLEKNYLDVRPLTFPAEKPAVPDDADIVIVADPQSALPEPAVAALRAYMNKPAKKGKLIVLAGAHAAPDRKMMKIGLEPLLAELNVQLGTKFVYNMPTQFLPSSAIVLTAFSRAAERNPILQAIIKVPEPIVFSLPREVEAIKANPSFTATDLILSDGRTWVEDEPIADVRAVVEPMLGSAQLQRARGVTSAPRSLAVTVTEGDTARAAVFGNSFFVSDQIARQTRSEAVPLSFDLFGVTVDWLRDRPSIAAAGVEAKQYMLYSFPQPAKVDTMRLLYLPLGLAFLTVLGLGAGVWVIRRR
jgi:hypothetical protein